MDTSDPGSQLTEVPSAVTEDALVDAYNTFKSQFVTFKGFDKTWPIGYGYHPGLSTEKLVVGTGQTPKGQAKIQFAIRNASGAITTPGLITATIDDIPANTDFDLWFVKNIAGTGKTVKPESGDQMVKVGSFNAGPSANGGKTLSVPITSTQNSTLDIFDLDMVVVTRVGQSPTASRISVGSRTLFEKKFFRDLHNNHQGLDPLPAGVSLSNTVETNDPLVKRGAFLFFNETFGGNGRTCGSCHRAENNLTLDPAFIATLPQSDPLFVAENNPNLANLENSAMLRSNAVNVENLDGFNKQGVFRTVQHTFALATTIGLDQATDNFPLAPPDHRLGWSGDGAPGRGTLNEFGFGAIMQHFPKDLARRPGTDFRIPTQEELDSLEAFQLFTGRQKFVDATALRIRDTGAEAGRTLFLTGGQGGAQCTSCHLDMGQINGFSPLGVNFVLATGTNQLIKPPTFPFDDGFEGPRPVATPQQGDGSFNVQPLIEAADTAPFFHNGAKATIEDAVTFYTTPDFANSPSGFVITLSPTQIANIGAFLRVLNAAENIRQVRKRATFVRDNRSSGNTQILTIALRDVQDAINDLQQKNLNQTARNDLATAKLSIQTAQANADSARPPYLDNAITWLNLASTDLFTSNPNGDF
jgi:cytochrome c peroxidase